MIALKNVDFSECSQEALEDARTLSERVVRVAQCPVLTVHANSRHDAAAA